MDPTDNVQGTFLGMPYDFRTPTRRRIQLRLFNPAAGPFTPHVWGWGYTLNLGNPLSWVLILLATLLVLVFTF